MKKKGILILLVLMLVVMVGCKAEAQPQDEAPQATESNEVEPTAPIESDEPAEPSEKVEPMTALVEVTQEDLTGYFETAYSVGQLYADLGYDGDSLIKQELEVLSSFVEDGTAKWPDDVYDQYREWREANNSQQAETPAPEAEAPASNPQTQPSTNNQPQPVSNQTGPGGATIVHDPSSDYSSPSGSLANGGERAPDEVITSEDMGYAPIDPSKIIYGGN